MQLLLNRDEFVWAIGAFCQLNRIPFDAELLLRQFPPPYNQAHLQQALNHLGFDSHIKKRSLAKLPAAALPCLVLLKPNSRPHTPSTASAIETTIHSVSADTDAQTATTLPNTDKNTTDNIYPLALILSRDGDRLLVIESNQTEPRTINVKEFASAVSGQFLLVRKQPASLDDIDTKPPPRFGFKWFVPELLKYKRIWSEVLIASLAMQLVGLAVPVCTQIVIDKVVVHHTISTLVVIGIALAIFMIFTAAMGWIRQYLVLHTGNRIDATLGHKVFSHLLDLPVRYYDNRPTGVIIARVHGVETIREFLAGGLVTLLLDFPFLIVFLAIMFWYSWQLSLISLAGLTIIALISLIVTPLIRKRLNHQFMLGARNQAFLTEYVSGMETVKSLQMEPQLKNTFGEFLGSYLGASFASRQLSNTYNIVANGLDQLQTLTILCVGAWLVMHDSNFTIGMLVAFQMFSGRLSGPVMRLVGLWQEFQQADIAVKRLGDVMNAPAEPYSLLPKRANQVAPGQLAIQVESLAFRYSDQHPWLYKGLSFNIQPGHCAVIMGPSGCGKSTFAKLMLGFYQPQEGSIKVFGQDISYLSANELRNYFGVVPQETTLFSGTIYDNLILANPHASFEQIIQACQLAEIHHTIEKMPQGYQTRIGEHGTGLSGGQKQRIAIARALLKQPSILIFDEAVSNLDTQTAEHFAQTVNKLKGKVTIIFITHQLPKGLQVDQAVILGKEVGSVNPATHQQPNNTNHGTQSTQLEPKLDAQTLEET